MLFRSVVNRSVLRGKDSVGGYTLFTVSDSLYIAEKRIGEEAFQWGALSLTPKMYVEPDGKLRPSYGVNSKYRQVKRVWEQSLGSSIYGSAGEGNGLVFVGLNNGWVKALSADKGNVVWKYQTQSRIVSTPVAVGDVVLVASTDGNLYCLRGKSGELVWKFRSGRPLLGIPTVSDDVVYIGGSNGKFYALQLSSGEELWSYDDLGSFVETKPVVTDNAVIFGAWDSYLYALDKRSGALLWRWNNGNERKHFSAAAVWPVVSNGKVYVAAPDRYLTGVNLSDGSTAWRTNETQVRESVGMSVDGKTLYSRSMNDSVVAYDVTGSLPALKWKVNAEYGYDHNPTMMVERNGVVVFATKNGEVVAVNAADGSVKWRHKIGNATINTLTPVGSADWVVTTVDGLVVRLTER